MKEQLCTKRASFMLVVFSSIFIDYLLFVSVFSYFSKIGQYHFNYMTQILCMVVLVCFILPVFIFSNLGGQLSDKYCKLSLLKKVKMMELPIICLSIISLYLENYTLLLLSLLIISIKSAIFNVIKFGIIPELFKHSQLIRVNGYTISIVFLALLVGSITGYHIINLSNDYNVILFAIISICVTLSGLYAMRFLPQTSHHNDKLDIQLNLFAAMSQDLQYIATDRNIMLSILGISWISCIIAVFQSTNYYLISYDNYLSIIFSAIFFIGLVVGSLTYGTTMKSLVVKYLPIYSLLITLFLLDLSNFIRKIPLLANDLGGYEFLIYKYSFWRVAIDIFIIAVNSGLFIVPLYTLILTKAQHSIRSRIIASNIILNYFFVIVIYVVIMALLVMNTHFDTIFQFLAICSLVVSIYICKLLPQTIIKSVLKAILINLYKVEVHGLENYHKAGNRVLIIANHTSYLDVALLIAFIPDDATFVMNNYQAQRWWIKPLLMLVKTYYIEPTDPLSARGIVYELRRNRKVVMFPEGRMTNTGSLMKIYEGPGMVADIADAKLLPIRINGIEYSRFSLLNGRVKSVLFPKIKITILESRKLGSHITDLKGRARRQAIGNELYDIMSEMIFATSDTDSTLFESLLEVRSKHGSGYIIAEDVERNPTTVDRVITGSYILGRHIEGQPGEYVGIFMPNMVVSVILVFGVIAYGKVPTLLNYSAGMDSILSACKTASIKTIYTSMKFIDKIEAHHIITAIEKQGIKIVYLENLKQQITLLDKLHGYIVSKLGIVYHKYVIMKKYYKDQIAADMAALLLFTSGSEGEPKGVVLSHRNIQSNIQQLSARIDLSSTDIFFNTLPMFHTFGATATLLCMVKGIRFFFYPNPLHYRIIPEMVYDTDATVLFGTDTFLSGYAKYAHAYDFYNIRLVVAGAEKLREETRKIWTEKYGIRILEGYGTTEAAPAISVNTPMQNKTGTVGRLLPGIKHKLVAVEGITTGGKLLVKGSNIMKGYLMPDKPLKLQSGRLPGGWYDTGDIVSVDTDGYVTILDRVKRFAKIGGEMIPLKAVEEKISSLWEKYDHAVISIRDKADKEQLLLLTTYNDATTSDIAKYFGQNSTPNIYIPKKIVTIDEIPILPSGKTDYVTIKKIGQNQT